MLWNGGIAVALGGGGCPGPVLNSDPCLVGQKDWVWTPLLQTIPSHKSHACISLQPRSLTDSRCPSRATVLTALRKIQPQIYSRCSRETSHDPSHAASIFSWQARRLPNIWGRELLFTGFGPSRRESLPTRCNLFGQIAFKKRKSSAFVCLTP